MLFLDISFGAGWCLQEAPFGSFVTLVFASDILVFRAKYREVEQTTCAGENSDHEPNGRRNTGAT